MIESPALMPFLPGLSRRLLGEKLKLPSVATWWCGQPEALDYVRDHLDSLVIKPAFQPHGVAGRANPCSAAKLSGEERRETAGTDARPALRFRGAGDAASLDGPGLVSRTR